LLGATCHALKRPRDAADAFARSVTLDPSHLESHLGYVSVLREAGNFHGALAASKRALARFPATSRILCAAALCHEDLQDLDTALAHYDAALAVDPNLDDALHNRGLLLIRMGRLPEAERHLIQYAEAHQDSVRAHDVLADLLFMLGRMEDALESLRTSEHLAPGRMETQIRQGAALACLGRFAEARERIQTAHRRDAAAVEAYVQRIAPGSDPIFVLSPENLYLTLNWLRQGRCDWTTWDSCTAGLLRITTELDVKIEPAATFMSFHLPLSGHERLALAQQVATRIENVHPPLSPTAKRSHSRIRIGILSPDLREHLNGYLLLPLFELLDRRRFEVYAYSLSGEDGSGIRARLRASADQFRELQGVSDRNAAATIREDDIDIVLDVGGHTTNARFAITVQRPGRVQALYLGFPGSLGSHRVDFAICDRVAAGAPSEWTESLVYLPHTYFLYDFRETISGDSLSRPDCGIPEDCFVYCAFHKAEKITPDAFDLWMRVLNRVPRSVLWFPSLSDAAQVNLRREGMRRGVDPQRLIFARYDSRERYLARQRSGDLMLDAVHHSAMTTACDAMAVGLPVLTLPGNAMASRAGESLARAAGVPEMVARDKDDYVKKAVFLAQNPQQLKHIRQRLVSRTGPLFDTVSRVRELEQAFLEIWRRHEQRH
jgi:protein O-GlcNAc transferase